MHSEWPGALFLGDHTPAEGLWPAHIRWCDKYVVICHKDITRCLWGRYSGTFGVNCSQQVTHALTWPAGWLGGCIWIWRTTQELTQCSTKLHCVCIKVLFLFWSYFVSFYQFILTKYPSHWDILNKPVFYSTLENLNILQELKYK